MKKYRFIWYAVMSIGLPKIISLIMSTLNNEFFSNEWITYVIFFGICILIAVLLELITYLIHQSKKEIVSDSVHKIDFIGDKYRIPLNGQVTDEEHIAMFDVPKLEEELVAHFKGKYHPVIYYLLSAKEYLNWIDFVYFSYLRDLKKKLKCEVIIALHYNDKLRTTKMNKETDIKRYNIICQWFSIVIRKIIGEDTRILKEDQFYKQNPKDYAVNFHNLYVTKILEYVEKMDENTPAEERLNYTEFKRKLSYVESAFPIKEIASKYKRSKRLFVLDRETSQEIWKDSTLLSIKNESKMIFISAKTLCYENGKYINVHNKENVPNFTDSLEILTKKIHSLDLYTCKLMYSLLSTNINQTHQTRLVFPSDELIPNLLIEKICSLNVNYHFDIETFEKFWEEIGNEN